MKLFSNKYLRAAVAVLLLVSVGLSQQTVRVTDSKGRPILNTDVVHVIVDSGSVSFGGGDPCSNPSNTFTTSTFHIASTTVAKIVSKTSAKKTYACAFYEQTGATAETWSLLEGTKSSTECDTGAAALSGSTTAASGNSTGANGGVALGNGGASVFRGITANVDWCIADNGTNPINVTLVWTQQ